MEHNLPSYKTIDLEAWPRREHFQYYRGALKCSYSLTGRVDVTNMEGFARRESLRFYGCALYAISRAVNSMEEMRLMVDPSGAPGIWEVVHPNFTVFHQDDKTFSDIWTEYRPEFGEFYAGFQRTLERYGENHGVKARPDQPANFFCVSCVPWMDYTGYSSCGVGEPALFPIVTFGKYREENGRRTMPVTLTISHASADGYHACQFFQRLQQVIDAFPQTAAL